MVIKMKNRIIIFLSLLLLFIFNGCVGITEDFEEIKNKIISQLEDDYKSQIQFSVGSAGITISTWFVDFAADEEFISDMMNDVSGVQVGVYERIKGSDPPNFTTLRAIEDDMQSNGWKSIVRSFDGEELSAVYLRSNSDEMLKRIFVINYTEDELVLVEVEGDLKQVISTIIREKGIEINM